MKTAAEVKTNYAPVYAALYPGLAAIFVKHGYALAVHGSMARDFDLIAVPWVDEPSEHQPLIDEICKTFYAVNLSDPAYRPHGRLAYKLSIGFGECAIDLSFMPVVKP